MKRSTDTRRGDDTFLESHFCNVAAAMIGSAVIGAAMAPEAPDAPDMSGSNEAARRAADLADRKFADYEANFQPRILRGMDQAEQMGMQQHQRAMQMQDFQLGLAQRFNNRYWNTQAPLEDSIIQDARNFNTEDERNRIAGLARGDVEMEFANSQAQMMREMGRSGMDPSSPAAQLGLARMQTDRALASATAMTKTREAARQLGWTRKTDAAALARGMPGFSSQSAQLAANAGSLGLNASNNGLNAGIAGSGAANQSFGAVGNMLGTAGNLYGIGMNATTANNQLQFQAAQGRAAPIQSVAGMYAGGEMYKHFYGG